METMLYDNACRWEDDLVILDKRYKGLLPEQSIAELDGEQGVFDKEDNNCPFFISSMLEDKGKSWTKKSCRVTMHTDSAIVQFVANRRLKATEI